MFDDFAQQIILFYDRIDLAIITETSSRRCQEQNKNCIDLFLIESAKWTEWKNDRIRSTRNE